MFKLSKKSDDNRRKTEREKVEERREEVLSNGRKYKYPLQYAKHRIVMLTTVVTVLALVILAIAGWVALYKTQNTSDILYRITQILPVSVANIDGENVRYSDYLMIYRSTITPIEKQQGQLGHDEDSDAMRAYYKRQALTEAENYTYALKLARELGIEVTDEEVTAAVNAHRAAGGVERSEEIFKRILEDNFGLSMNEYRRMVYLSLVTQKVAAALDKTATLVAADVETDIKNGVSFQEIAGKYDGRVLYEETGGLVDVMNVDGGRSEVAMSLNPGEVSERFISNAGNGYYYVRLTNKGEVEVSYESLEIPFTELKTDLEKIRGEGRVSEGIDLPEIDLTGGSGE